MIKFKNIFFLTLSMVALAIVAKAQPDIEVDQVEVIKNFDAYLLDAEKLKLVAPAPNVEFSTDKSFTYNVQPKPLAIQYPAPQIRPIAYAPDKIPAYYNGYLRLGAGMPFTILGEGAYHYDNKENFFADVALKHHSTNNSKIENQRFSNTGLQLSGTYFTPSGIGISPRIGYDFDNYYLYGYDHDDTTFTPPTKDEAKRKLNTFTIGAKVFNGEENKMKINWYGDVGFYFHKLSDFTSAVKENGTLIKIGGSKWFNEKHPLNVEFGADLSKYTDSVTAKLNNIYLSPSFTYHGETFKAKIGLNLYSGNDEISIFPDVEVAAQVAGNQAVVYAGWTGKLAKNSLRNMDAYNPYLWPTTFAPKNANVNNIFAGVKGSIGGIQYDLGGGYKIVKNMALFQSLIITDLMSGVLYDSVNTFYLQATGRAKLSDNATAHVQITKNFFDAKNQIAAWGHPDMEANLGLIYTTMEDKLQLKADLYGASGIPFHADLADADKVIKGKPLFDVSLGAEYFFIKNIGAFAQLNNLVGNKYQRWKQYPTYGINFVVGVSARF